MKDNVYDEPTTIVFLLGKAGCGKDTIGAILVEKYGYIRVAFADAVKADVAKMHNIDVQDLHRQGPIKEHYRSAVISYAEAEKAKDQLCWFKKAFLPYKDENNQFKKGLKLVVTDCRRESEIDWILNQKDLKHRLELQNTTEGSMSASHYLTVRLFLVSRPDGPIDPDILTHKCISYAMGMHKGLSDTTQIRLVDGVIQNNRTIDQLEAKVKQVVETFKLDHIYKERVDK